jgi:CHAT domain-containing protein/tetratricopeptide (TPR) repeat protein
MNPSRLLSLVTAVSFLSGLAFSSALAREPEKPASIPGEPFEAARQLARENKADAAVALGRNLVAEAETRFGLESPDICPALNQLADLHMRLRQYQPAREILERVLRIRREHQAANDPLLGDAYYEMGWFCTNFARYEEGQQMFRDAMAVYRGASETDEARLGSCQNGLGVLYENMGRYELAEEHFLQALELRKRSLGPTHERTATTINNLATLYWSMGDYSRAETWLKQALEMRESALGPESLSTATTMNNLALLYGSMGDAAAAGRLFERVLKIREKKLGPHHLLVATSLNNLGLLRARSGNLIEAEKLLRRAVDIRRRTLDVDHPDLARSLFHLACAHDLEKAWEKAAPLHQEALDMRMRALGPHHPETAGSLYEFAVHYHRQGLLTKARSYYEEALKAQMESLGAGHSDTMQTLESLAWLHLDYDQPDLALQIMRRALDARERQLNHLFSFATERQRIAFQRTLNLADLPASVGSASDLARVLLRTKGLVLDTVVEDQLAAQASTDASVRALLDELRAVSNHWMRLKLGESDGSETTESAEIERRETQLQSQLFRKVAGTGKARKALQVIPSAVQNALPDGAVLVEFLRYERYSGTLESETRYGALVLPKQGDPVWVPLGLADDLDLQIGRYQAHMRKAVRSATVRASLRDLFNRVWWPVQQAFPSGTATVIISPDGELNFVSFATLLNANDQFVAERFELQYVSSGRDLLRANQPASGRRNLVVFAAPAFDAIAEAAEPMAATRGGLLRVGLEEFSSRPLQPLPGATVEAEVLRDLAEPLGLQPRLFLGAEASEKHLSETHSPFILHLATHGLFLPPQLKPPAVRLEGAPPPPVLTNPMHRSILALAGAQATLDGWRAGKIAPVENDGILTAAEVGMLDLHDTWLVVLSACDTGAGEARNGEGVLGLRRGFALAGARNLLLTLWPVGDGETVDFMRAFYRQALESRHAPSALARVQRDHLVKLRRERGLALATRIAGPFILNY